jgi:hypothetical protein
MGEKFLGRELNRALEKDGCPPRPCLVPKNFAKFFRFFVTSNL